MFIMDRNSKKFKAVVLLCIVLTALSFTGCKKDSETDKKKVQEAKRKRSWLPKNFSILRLWKFTQMKNHILERR